MAVILFDPDPETSVETGVYALFGFSNIHFYLMASDYYGPEAALNAFAQTWSLGVEEQFYLLFPLLLWLLTAGQVGRGGRVIGVAIFWFSLLSLVSFVYLYERNQPAAFFLLPTRAWELGIGCLLFLGIRAELFDRYFPRRKPTLALLLVLVALMFLPERYAVQATIAVVFVTALVIGAVRDHHCAYKILTFPIVLYIGQISYSLYLWHWSVLSVGLWIIGDDEWWVVVFKISLVFMLASMSFFFVESPLRKARPSMRRVGVIACGLTSSILVALACIVALWLASGLKNEANAQTIEYPPLFLPLKNSNLPFNPTCVVDNKDRQWTPEKFDLCTVQPKEKDGKTIWVLGDSHANHLQGLLYALHDKIGVGVHLIGTPGTPFPVRRTDPAQPRDEIFQRISERLKAGDIVLIARLFINRDGFLPIDPPGWQDDVQSLAAKLRQRNVSLVIMGPLPNFSFLSVKQCSVSQGNRKPCVIERSLIEPSISAVYKSLYELGKRSDNIYVFNQFELLCPGNSDMCSPIRNGISLFDDRDHLNSYGAASLSGPFIEFMKEKGVR